MEEEAINLKCNGPSSDVKNVTYTWYKDGKHIAIDSKDTNRIKINKQW